MKRGETAADDGGRKGGTAAQRGKIAVDDREKEKTEKGEESRDSGAGWVQRSPGHLSLLEKEPATCKPLRWANKQGLLVLVRGR